MDSSAKVSIAHLVIVTGPTSSGKSTLLASIRAGELDEELKARLPAEASLWEEYQCKEYDGSVKLGESKEGLLLHYDFMRPYKKFHHGYEEDLASKLMDLAERVTVFVIKPEREKLIQQLRRGELMGEKIESGRKSLYLRSALTRALHVIPAPVRLFVKNVMIPGRRRSITDFNKILYFKYQETGWLEAWYDKFHGFLKCKKDAGINIHVHYIRPDNQKRNSWVVLEQERRPCTEL